MHQNKLDGLLKHQFLDLTSRYSEMEPEMCAVKKLPGSSAPVA